MARGSIWRTWASPTFKSLQFVFGTQQNGWVGYNELAAQGAPSAPGLTWTGLQGSGGNGNWDFLTQNWTDTPTLTQSLAYADSNAVTFDNTGAASGNTNISITSNVSPVSVTFNNSSTPYTFSGAAISGTGAVTLTTAAGSVTFNSQNTYTGGTFVNGGTLNVGHDRAISGGPLAVGAAGLVNFTSLSPTIGGLSGSGSVVLGNATAGTPTNLNVNNTSNTTFAGTIGDLSVTNASATGSLTVGGPHMLTLTGNGTYTGGTTITGGTLAAAGTSLGSGNIYLVGGTFHPVVPPAVQTVTLSVGGTPTVLGSYNWAGGSSPFTITAGGGDFWGNPTQGYFVYTTVPTNQNFDVAIHVPANSIVNSTDGWAKLGIMARSDASANSVSTVLNAETSGNQVSMQYVNTTQNYGGQGVSQGPEWVRLTYNQATDSFTGYEDSNAADNASLVAPPSSSGNWVNEGSYTVPMANSTFLLGIAETAHNNGNATGVTGTVDSLGTLLPYLTPSSFQPLFVGGNSTLDLASGQSPVFPSLTIGASGASTLHVTSGPATLTVPTTTITNSPTFDVQGSNVLNLGTLTATDAGGFTKTGAGTLLLPNANNYSGTTKINAGSVVSSTVNSLGTGPIVLNGGNLNVAGGVPGLQVMELTNYGALNLGTPFAANKPLELGVLAAANNINGSPGNVAGAYASHWTTNGLTWAYSGYIYLPPSATGISFARQWDDDGLLTIDGTALISDTTWNNLDIVHLDQGTSETTTTYTPGWHQIEVRLADTGGGIGVNGGWTGPGFGIDFQGLEATQTLTGGNFGTLVNSASNFILPIDPGNGSLFTTGAPGLTTYSNLVSVTAPSSITVSGLVGFSNTASLGSVLSVSGSSVAGVAQLQFQGGTNLTSGAGLNVAAGVNVTLASPVSDGGTPVTFSVAGAGYTTLTGANTFTAGTNFNVAGGNLVPVGQSLTTGPLGGAPITLNNGTLQLAGSSAMTFDPAAGNPVTLTPGTNDSIMAGSSAALSGGTVTMIGSLAVPPGTTLNLGYVNGSALTVNTVFSNSGTITAMAGNLVSLPFANLPVPGTLSAASGGTLTVSGAVNAGVYTPAAGGLVYLSGAYSGPLANLVPQTGGALVVTSNSTTGTLNVAGGAYVAVTGSSFGPATLSLNGGSLAAAQGVTIGNAITWGATPTINFTGPGTMNLTAPISLVSGTYNVNDPNTLATFSGVISGAGALNITGNPTLSNVNTYAGGTTLTGANVTVNNPQAFGTGTITFNNGGGLNATTPLQGNMAIPNTWAIAANATANFNGANAFQLSGSTTLPAGSESIQITNAGLSVTLSGPIGGAGATLVQSSATGTLVIDNPGNTFGGFTVVGGVVDVHGASTLPVGATGTNITSGPLGIGTVTLGTGGAAVTLANNGGSPVTLGNTVDLASGTFTSLAGLTLSGNINLSGTLSNISVTANSNVVLAGPITGNSINFSGANGLGSLTISGSANPYSGNTSIASGTLIVGNNAFLGYQSVLGNSSSAITVGNSAGLPAALVAGGPLSLGYGVTIDRPVTVTSTGPTTLGDITAGDASLPNFSGLNGYGSFAGGAAFTGPVVINSNVTLSAAPGGSVAFSGNISGAGGITAASQGNGNVSLSNTNSYTGSTGLLTGQLTLDYTNVTNYTVTSSGTTVGGVVPPTSPVLLSGGTLAVNDNLSFIPVYETFASTQVANVGSVVVVNNNNGGGVQINLGPITRSGGVLDLPINNATFTTTSTNTNGILGGYMTVNGYSDWAVNSGVADIYGGPGQVIAGLASVAGGYTLSTAAGAYVPANTNNIDVVDLASAPQTSTTVNSLRFDSTPAGTMALGGTLTLASGGILVTPNLGTNNVTISGGALTASGGQAGNSLADVVVIQGNTSAPFVIASPIIDNGSTPVALTKGGPGTLELIGPNTYTGGTSIAAGTLQLGDGNPAHDTVLAGNISNNGALVINLGGSQTYGGQVSGIGSFTKSGTGTLTLTSTAQTYTGATVIKGGTLQLQLTTMPGLAVNFYHSDPGGSGFPGSSANQLLWNTQAGLTTFLASQTLVYTTNSAADGNTQLNFNGPNGNGGQAFNGSNGPGNIGYTDSNGGNNYDAILTGWINLPAGTSNFTTRSDDGSMLYIDGATVVNNNGYQGMTNRSGSVTEATAGPHQIEIAYYQGGGGAGLEVFSDLTGTNVIANGTGVDQVYQVLGGGSLPSTTPLTIASGATFDLNGVSQQVASLADYTLGSGGSVISSSNLIGTPTLTLAPVGGAASTFSGTIGGGGQPLNVVMNGNGTQVLNGAPAGHGQPDGPAGPAGLRRREPDGRRHDPQ